MQKPIKKWRADKIKQLIKSGQYLQIFAKMLDVVAQELEKPKPEKKFIVRLTQLSNDLLYLKDDYEVKTKRKKE